MADFKVNKTGIRKLEKDLHETMNKTLARHTDKPVEDAARAYQKEMKKAGFTITMADARAQVRASRGEK